MELQGRPFQKLFIGLSFLLLIGMPILSFDFVLPEMNLCINRMGKRTQISLMAALIQHIKITYKILYLYGALFDASAAMVYENMPKSDPYTIRHFLNSLLFGTGLMILRDYWQDN